MSSDPLPVVAAPDAALKTTAVFCKAVTSLHTLIVSELDAEFITALDTLDVVLAPPVYPTVGFKLPLN